MEAKINQIAGVVTNGLFMARPANVLLATADGVKTYKNSLERYPTRTLIHTFKVHNRLLAQTVKHLRVNIQ
jgi:hypothetical protein